ncbi:hatching enzyme 1.2-like [Clytia hemisphaerica]|uniref:Metalloendopeptidase n=1 Tax=Clytia hemisphaerica TaxID=252671 RepID=A0A7M5X1X8_9CNID
MKGIFYIFSTFCVFAFLHGHPLEQGEEESAFENINKANQDLPIDLEQGDMMILQDGAVDKKYNRYWKDGYVPYTISNQFGSDEKQRIRSALDDIMEAARCLTFQEFNVGASNVPTAHVRVIKSSGCWSLVGRTGRQQDLSLGNGCVYTGTIIHEFLHAIGFYHEQSRPDRDSYIRINWGDIQSGREHNFNIQKNINSLGIKYDPKSVMHYSNGAFAKSRGLKTIEWKADPSMSLGGRVLTASDKQQINLKYCKGPVTTTTTRTTKTRPTRPTTRSTRPTTRPTRPTKSTVRPTAPPTEVCGDKSGFCISARRYQGRCGTRLSFLCPRSCRKCTGPEDEKCLNLKDQRNNCLRKSQKGECRIRNYRRKWRMKNDCPRTCCERGELYK